MKENQQTWFQKLENLHPYQTMVYLGMIGSGLIFLFLTVAFLASGYGGFPSMGIKLPKSFVISTFVIMLSGYTVSNVSLHFREERLRKLKNNLFTTFLLGVIFTVLQFLGWLELKQMGVDFKGLPSGSFLYVLSGIHVFHLVGAMIFGLIMVLQYGRREKDQVGQLIMLTNPFEKMRISLFATYWHFMDLIWLMLFLVFVLSF
ncbi:heme-copper oxidase subunit III [Belliella kenyensis]|uniref:Heme-copper oxidase subunit III n=1 Tax=Belliella kenyensis TaxID=1472724 RepID=A0ABV8ER34_9BACT|nr:cytochrome c oxidase subunit 3 [Belliella kenyensis]MCH7401665.1 cytochrome c oxidase subunit 3 [Belliella kenyensis]MDN3603057.1 cytochrome c oxidase subunit 3 [Belliella kenyensis]